MRNIRLAVALLPITFALVLCVVGMVCSDVGDWLNRASHRLIDRLVVWSNKP